MSTRFGPWSNPIFTGKRAGGITFEIPAVDSRIDVKVVDFHGYCLDEEVTVPGVRHAGMLTLKSCGT